MEKDSEFLVFLKRCEIKDREAWNTFVDKYSNYIYLYINKILGRYNGSSQNGEAGEIFNSVFSTLLNNDCKELKKFQGRNEYSFLAFLREISFLVTLDFLRIRKKLVDKESARDCFPKPDRSMRRDCKDIREIIITISDELPQRHHYLFRLIYKEGLDSSEIAEIMNVNRKTFTHLKFSMLKNLIKIAKRKGLYRELKKFLFNPPFTILYPLAENA
jgi:RNA polymerase sigma factor (sigma-70 family)